MKRKILIILGTIAVAAFVYGCNKSVRENNYVFEDGKTSSHVFIGGAH